MRYIRVNLDFEYELATGQPTPRAMLERLKLWERALRLAPGWQEALIADTSPLEDNDELLFWGLSPSTRALLKDDARQPSPDAVRLANDKRTSHELERALGIALPGSAILESLDQARAWVKAQAQPWVIKHPMGVSGRDRTWGQGPQLEERALGWLRRQLERTSLLAEPWVERTSERSTQLVIEPDGRFKLIGALELITDKTGTFRGHIVAPTDQAPAPLQQPQQLEQIAQALYALGYWGPVGIDAFEGRLHDMALTRPLVELNARWTFGRLALELRHHAPPGWWIAWWHPPHSAPSAHEGLPCLSQEIIDAPAVLGLYRLPELADPGAKTGVWCAAAPTRAALARALSALGVEL